MFRREPTRRSCRLFPRDRWGMATQHLVSPCRRHPLQMVHSATPTCSTLQCAGEADAPRIIHTSIAGAPAPQCSLQTGMAPLKMGGKRPHHTSRAPAWRVLASLWVCLHRQMMGAQRTRRGEGRAGSRGAERAPAPQAALRTRMAPRKMG
jgi:hypothetical protein